MGAILLETLRILNESAIYLLLGFAIAGLLHAAVLRREGLLRPLERPGWRPVVLAALIGAPLPLCSCGVLPAGVMLNRRGASKGATASFLVTCPETDIVSILLTYALLGPAMAIFRPLAALVTGISAGLAINLIDRPPRPRPGEAAGTAGSPGDARDACLPSCGNDGCSGSDGNAGRDGSGGSDGDSDGDRGAGGDGCCAPATSRPAVPSGRLRWWQEAFRFGFTDLFDDLIGRLLIGLLLAGAIGVVFSRLDLAAIAGIPVLAYFVMLVIGIPLYICATASTPVAAGLIAAGISPGAALVLLLAGPAVSMASMVVLWRQFGRVAFIVFVGAVAVFSVAAGIALDTLIRLGFIPAPDPRRLIGEDGNGVGAIAAGLFLLLAVLSLVRRRFDRRLARAIERITGLRVSGRSLLIGAVALALLAWLISGCFIVRPGERAAVTRFGAVTAPYLGPGLHVHWPVPLGGYDRIEVNRIRRVEIGFRSGPSTAGLDPALQDEEVPAALGGPGIHGSPTESWVLTGDENIIDIQGVARYQVRETPEAVHQAMYGVGDLDALVRAKARWALQEAVGGRGIDELLTTERAEVERAVRDELMQPALDAARSGIRLVDFRLVSVHAPTPVHWAFRDVAGAAEDAVQYVNNAHEYAERIVREARGDSARGVSLAWGGAADRTSRAAGEAAAFTALSREERKNSPLTRSRLHLEKLETVLPGLDLYIDLTGSKDRGPDLWLQRGRGFESLPFGGLAAPGSTPPKEKP